MDKRVNETPVTDVTLSAGVEMSRPRETQEQRFLRICKRSHFEISREDAVFFMLCYRFEKNGKAQFYKAAELAEELESMLQRRENLGCSPKLAGGGSE